MRKKILFVVPSLRGGGAERVMVTLLKNLPRDKFELHLALVEKIGPYLSEIPEDVTVYDLNAKRVRYVFKSLIKIIRDITPDTVFSTIGHLNIALIILKPLFPLHTKLIIRETSIASISIGQKKSKIIWDLAYKALYGKVDKIVCQSKYMAEDLIQKYHIKEEKIVIIYNPIDLEQIILKVDEDNPFASVGKGPHVLTVSRLIPAKALHRVIEALPHLLNIKPETQLWILGEGPLKEDLVYLAKDLRIEKNINFMGFQGNPYKWMKHADLFILASLYEGLPNVLLEAIACGCPVVVLQHPGGTKEIMEKTGLLYRYVENLDWKEEWFTLPDKQIKDRVMERFSSEVIVSLYAKLFN